MELRVYQQEAINAIYSWLRNHDGNPCCVAPTGSGKAILIAQVCKDAVLKWGGRVCVVAHVKELLEQEADKLQKLCPEVKFGVYSAGLGSKEKDGDVIIAGIQSVYKKAEELGGFNLILVDECHLIPPSGDGMYQTFLQDMKQINPRVRLIGFTATPYRTGSGYIVGDDQLLTDVCYDIGIKELIRDGYLSKLTTKGGSTKPDCSSLHIDRGEFVASEVEELVNTPENVCQACYDIVQKTRDRKSVLIFACSVEHAYQVKETIKSIIPTESCEMITGETSSDERAELNRRFRGLTPVNLLGEREKQLKYLVNVNVLTTGFDAPNCDCVVLLRPTASPVLYSQMVGRGFRIADGKDNCLILDYGGNVERHGPVDSVVIRDGRGRTGTGDNSRVARECPECQTICSIAYARCPDCGFEFPPPEKRNPKHDEESCGFGIISGEVTMTDHDVQSVSYQVWHKKDATPETPNTMRINYEIGFGEFVSEWVCPEHSGWARVKFVKWWSERSNEEAPTNTDDAVEIAKSGGLALTTHIFVKHTAGKKFPEIVKYSIGDKPDVGKRVKVCQDCAHWANGWCAHSMNTGINSYDVACSNFITEAEIPF